MMSEKLATLGFLEMKIFWNKGLHVVVSAHGVTKKFFVINYVVDVVMWTKFGNSSVSLREVIITSILYGLDQKNQFFWGLLLV